MARRLPWKPSATKPAPQSPSSCAASSPRVRPKPSPAQQPPSTPSSAAPKRRRITSPSALFERIRSPSTSPPPEPPQEEFMAPGDDRYRMVEDEFLHTAQRFTTHLHRAEYARLKALAKSQHASAISEMERPVVLGGTPTVSARLRGSTARRNARQRAVLKNPRAATAHDDNDNDNDIRGDTRPPWLGTSLQGLMETPRGEARDIASAAPAPPTTRAAAGYAHGSSAGSRPRDSHRSPSTIHGPGRLPRPSVRDGIAQVLAHDATNNTAKYLKRESKSDGGTSDDDDDPFNINRRRRQREKSRGQLRATSVKRERTPDAIPSFL